MRIIVFGASGPTGRQLTRQALAAGHRVTAVTRRPESVSERDGLTVVGADVADPGAVDAVVAGGDAVLSTLGVPYTREPISVYSVGARNVVAAMRRHDVKRLVVVSSAPLDPDFRSSDSFFFTQVMEPLFMRRPGRTTYEDMARMEAQLRATDLDWTIVRSCWLFNGSDVTDYHIAEDGAHGMFTARADLAACILDQLTNHQHVRRTITVITTLGTPSIVQQIWREGIKKAKK